MPPPFVHPQGPPPSDTSYSCPPVNTTEKVVSGQASVSSSFHYAESADIKSKPLYAGNTAQSKEGVTPVMLYIHYEIVFT